MILSLRLPDGIQRNRFGRSSDAHGAFRSSHPKWIPVAYNHAAPRDASGKPEINKLLTESEAREQSAALKPMLEESTGPELATSVRERTGKSN